MTSFDDQEKTVCSHWDQDATAWSAAVAAGQDIINDEFGLPAFGDFIGEIKGLQVLDLGCGEGRSSRYFSDRGARVVGLDISREMIAKAGERSADTDTGPRFLVGSASRMRDFQNASFDAVFSVMALMDMPALERVLHEAYRVIRPGGQFACIIRHPCFFTRGFQIVALNGKPRSGLVVADYLSPAPYVEHWGFTGAQAAERYSTPRFPRTLGQYLNALRTAGFGIDRIEEPRPSDMLCRRHPFLTFWQRHAALYLMMSASRPA